MTKRPRSRQPEGWEEIIERLSLTPGEKLLTAADVAQTLGLKRGKAFALLNSGELPVIRIGAALRIPASEFERWLDSEAAHRVAGDRRQRRHREREA